MKNKFIKIIGMNLLLVLLIGSISAFAVSSKYWEEYPLQISPGETKDVKIVLQNMAGQPNNVTVKGVITKGSEIAKLIDEDKIYSVPFGQKTELILRVSIPTEMPIGSNVDNIVLSFTTMIKDETGTFGFSNSVEKIIPVKIIEQPKIVTKPEREINPWTYLIGIIILIILIIIIIRITKKRKVK